MQTALVDDELWELIQPPLLRRTGATVIPAAGGSTGIAWQRLPRELGFGSGMTWWRRLREWHEAGDWQQLHELLLAGPRRSSHPAARDYLERKQAEGKRRREAIRCLKRQRFRVVFNTLKASPALT